jgi:hypothetical protein
LQGLGKGLRRQPWHLATDTSNLSELRLTNRVGFRHRSALRLDGIPFHQQAHSVSAYDDGSRQVTLFRGDSRFREKSLSLVLDTFPADTQCLGVVRHQMPRDSAAIADTQTVEQLVLLEENLLLMVTSAGLILLQTPRKRGAKVRTNNEFPIKDLYW